MGISNKDIEEPPPPIRNNNQEYWDKRDKIFKEFSIPPDPFSVEPINLGTPPDKSYKDYVPVGKPRHSSKVESPMSTPFFHDYGPYGYEHNISQDINAKLSQKIAELEQKVSDLHKQKTTSPPKHEPGFTAQEMLDFEKALDKLEQLSDEQLLNLADRAEELIDKNATVSEFSSEIQNLIQPTSLTEEIAKAASSERPSIMTKHNGWNVEPDGTQKCYNSKGELHRTDGPAEIRPNGTTLYYVNGNLHRDNGLPAMVGMRGTEKYAINGKYHRLGGKPAVVWSKGPFAEEWWINGNVIRATKRDGTKEWYAPGCDDRDEAILHNESGPAVVHPNGREDYYLNGIKFPNATSWLHALEQLNAERNLKNSLVSEGPTDLQEEAYTETTEKNQQKKVSESMKISPTVATAKPNFTEILKSNAVSAGYRVAGTQLTNLVKNSMLTVMRNKGADGGAVQAFASFLDTEFGEAMISFMIGSGLNYVPHFSDDARVQRLAEELRIGGMAVAGNAVIGEAMNHVIPAVSQILNNLPAAEPTASNMRVTETAGLSEALREEENEETVEAPAKTMKA